MAGPKTNIQSLKSRKSSESTEKVMFPRHLYSNAFLELLNSEVIEESPHHGRINPEINNKFDSEMFNFDMESCSESNSNDVSWNIITDAKQNSKIMKFHNKTNSSHDKSD